MALFKDWFKCLVICCSFVERSLQSSMSSQQNYFHCDMPCSANKCQRQQIFQLHSVYSLHKDKGYVQENVWNFLYASTERFTDKQKKKRKLSGFPMHSPKRTQRRKPSPFHSQSIVPRHPARAFCSFNIVLYNLRDLGHLGWHRTASVICPPLTKQGFHVVRSSCDITATSWIRHRILVTSYGDAITWWWFFAWLVSTAPMVDADAGHWSNFAFDQASKAFALIKYERNET